MCVANKADKAGGTRTPAVLYNKPVRGPVADTAWALVGAVFLVITGAHMLVGSFVMGVHDKIIMKVVPGGLVQRLDESVEALCVRLAKTMMKDEKETLHVRSLLVHMVFGVVPVVALHFVEWSVKSPLFLVLFYLNQHTCFIDLWRRHSSGHDHMEGHSTLTGGWFKDPFKWLTGWTQYVMLPLGGRIPEDDSVCHVYVHHKFCNNLDDVESHLWWDRSSFYQFAFQYVPRTFCWRHLHFGQLAYFKRNGFTRNYNKVLRGQLFYLGLTAASMAVDPFKGFYLFVAGAIAKNLIYNLGEWGMHAFSDPNHELYDPNLNCTTMLSLPHREDAFHAVHHAFGTTHSPVNKVLEEDKQPLLLAMRKRADNPAPVFKNYDWLALFFTLAISNDWDNLADNFVAPEGVDMTKEDIKAYLRRAVEPVKDFEGKTYEELEARKLVGIQSFSIKEAQANFDAVQSSPDWPRQLQPCVPEK